MLPNDPLLRILTRLVIDPETGCWLNRGNRQWCGTSIDRKDYECHRYVYERVHGPIPPKHIIHHTCRNHGCYNPGHLQALTYSQHTRIHPPHPRRS